MEDVWWNKIICGDSADVLKSIPSNTVSLITSSIPYNTGINYDVHNDRMPYQDYLKMLKKVFSEGYRTLRKGGRAVINFDLVGNHEEDREESYIRDLRSDFAVLMKEIGYSFFGEIIWVKTQRVGRATAWGSFASPSFPVIRRSHEYILVFSKEQFKLEKDDFSQETDLLPEQFMEWIDSQWPVQPETRKLGGSPVPWPEELVHRILKMFSYPGDLVIDAFSGSGTTATVCKSLKRRYIGIDLSEKYCQYARKRLAGNVDIFD